MAASRRAREVENCRDVLARGMYAWEYAEGRRRRREDEATALDAAPKRAGDVIWRCQ